MKLKLVTLIVFLLCIFACWSCSGASNGLGNSNSTQELEIFRTELKVNPEQAEALYEKAKKDAKKRFANLEARIKEA